MTGDMHLIVGGAVALAVGLGIARLSLQRRSTPGRLILLSALQALAGLLLFLTLFPPAVFRPGGVMVVATEGAPADIALKPDEVLVALPEAGPVAGAARAPDLATALRRHPETGVIRVVGHGLEARDRIATGRPLTFAPPPALVGLIAFTPPPPVPAGARFAVGGRVGAAPARAELIDPAGTVVDGADVKAGERFVLSGRTRVEGLALFTLRLTAHGRTVDRIAVPVEARADPRPVVLVLAGAAGAETRFLRRWAEDAGVDLRLQVDLGAGAATGDPAIALTPAALAGVDLVVIDDRRWERLGASQKAALAGAVEAGMGLLLRPEGPIPAAVQQDWAALNMPLTGGGDVRPTTLPKASSDGDGIELARVDLAADGPQTSVLARDESGAALVAWRPRGRGRVGVWTLTNSYVLALAGRGSEHGELWSAALTALSRPLRTTRPDIQAPAFAGSRMTLCGLAEGSVVVETGARDVPLLIDPAAGARSCAAWWPREAGWRLLRDRFGAETAFYVHPTGVSSALARAERRKATLALAAAPVTRTARPGQEPGSSWPWFAALLATLAALWWLERRHGTVKRADPARH